MKTFQSVKYRTFRAGLFATLGLWGVVPGLHALILYGRAYQMRSAFILDVCMGLVYLVSLWQSPMSQPTISDILVFKSIHTEDERVLKIFSCIYSCWSLLFTPILGSVSGPSHVPKLWRHSEGQGAYSLAWRHEKAGATMFFSEEEEVSCQIPNLTFGGFPN